MEKRQRYLYYNLKILKAITLLPINPKEITYYMSYKVWYFFWRFLCLFAIFYVTVCSSIHLYLIRDADITTKSATIVNLCIYIALIIRLFYFWFVEKETEELMELMFKSFRYETTTGLPKEINMEKYIKVSNIGCLIWFTTALSGAELYTIIDLLASNQRTMPMPTWHPYDVLVTPNYQLTCLLQIFSQAVMVLLMNGTDTFWSFTAYVTSGQFKLLAWEFENICYTAMVKVGFQPDEVVAFKESLKLADEDLKSFGKRNEGFFGEICDIFQSPGYNKVLNEELVKVVRFQKELLKFCDAMDSYWSGILLPMVLITQTYTTFSGFIMLLSTDATSIFRIWQYIIPMLLEIGFLTFSGQLLSNESEAIQLSIYKSPWYLCGKKFKNSLKIAHFRAKKGVVITMANFAAVDLKAYTYLMRSSLSYLAVLNKKRSL